MELLILFAAITALVWGMYLLPRWSPLLMAGGYLVLASMFGYDIFHFDVGISFSLDRIMLLVMLSSFGWHWWRHKTAPRDFPVSEAFLFCFMAVLVANTLSYDWQRNTPDQIPILQHLIEGYIIPFILYWVARRSVIKRETLDGLYLMFGIFGLYLVVTAFCETWGMWSLVFPKQIADPDLGIHFGRARGPFLQSVRMGSYLLICLFMSWIPLVWRKVWGRRGQLLGFVLFGLYTIAISATYTRSVWLGFAVAGLMVALMTFPRMLKRAAILGAVAASLIGLVVIQGDLLSFEREFGVEETRQSTEMRAVFAYVSWLMVKDRPVAGCGFGHFPHKNQPYLNDRSTRLELETIRDYTHHNTWLSVLVELGVVGFALYAALFVAWFRQARQLFEDQTAPPWARGQAIVFMLLVASYAVQMMFHDVSYSPMENGLLFMMAGLTSGICSMCQPVTTGQPLRSGRWKPLAYFNPSLN